MRAVPSSFAHQGRRLLLTDASAAALAPLVALALRGIEWTDGLAPTLMAYCAMGAGFGLAFLAYFRIGQILPRYLSRRDIVQIVKLAGCVAAFTAVAAFSIWRLDFIPRSVPVIHFIVLVALLAGWRAGAGAQERRRDAGASTGPRPRRIAILLVGAGPVASSFIRLLKAMGDVRPNVVGVLDDDSRLHGRSVDGHVIFGGLDRFEPLVAELASHGVELNRVVIAHLDVGAREAAHARLAGACAQRGVELDVLAERLTFALGEDDAAEADSWNLAVARTRAQRYFDRRRYAEAAVALAALVALAPVIALVAAAIRVRLGGPVMFWQQRVGRHGEPIVVHKFRTFAPAVDSQGNVLSEEARSSRLGHFLRAVRLDELPQLYDVLRGHMSLIGPRPLLPVDLPEDFAIRQSVTPGITGWAQIHGGKEITAEEKNALDEWYVYHASLRLDLRILWTTLRIVMHGDARRHEAIEAAIAFRAERVAREQRARPGERRGQNRAPAAPAPIAAALPAARAAGGQVVEFPRAIAGVQADQMTGAGAAKPQIV